MSVKDYVPQFHSETAPPSDLALPPSAYDLDPASPEGHPSHSTPVVRDETGQPAQAFDIARQIAPTPSHDMYNASQRREEMLAELLGDTDRAATVYQADTGVAQQTLGNTLEAEEYSVQDSIREQRYTRGWFNLPDQVDLQVPSQRAPASQPAPSGWSHAGQPGPGGEPTPVIQVNQAHDVNQPKPSSNVQQASQYMPPPVPNPEPLQPDGHNQTEMTTSPGYPGQPGGQSQPGKTRHSQKSSPDSPQSQMEMISPPGHSGQAEWHAQPGMTWHSQSSNPHGQIPGDPGISTVPVDAPAGSHQSSSYGEPSTSRSPGQAVVTFQPNQTVDVTQSGDWKWVTIKTAIKAPTFCKVDFMATIQIEGVVTNVTPVAIQNTVLPTPQNC